MDTLRKEMSMERGGKIDCTTCKWGRYNDHWDTHFCYNKDECNNFELYEKEEKVTKLQNTLTDMKCYKMRFIPLLSTDLWVREVKRFFWSKWEMSKSAAGGVISFRKTGQGFQPEWKYTKTYEDREIVLL